MYNLNSKKRTVFGCDLENYDFILDYCSKNKCSISKAINNCLQVARYQNSCANCGYIKAVDDTKRILRSLL